MIKIKKLTPQSKLSNLLSGDIVNLLGISFKDQDEVGIVVDPGRRRDMVTLVAMNNNTNSIDVVPFFVSSKDRGETLIEGDGRLSYSEGTKTYKKYNVLFRRFQ